VDALIEELAHPGPGARAMARSLLQAALVQALRGRELPWLAGLEDERLARALTAILDDPAAPHSVESLAGEAHMSRSAFARAFRDAFGEGPMSLLKQVRLSRAARLLATSDLPTKSVAAEVGYESRSAFSRSFAAHFGLSPQAWRDQHA
jgi:AraC family transcriptional activator of mtrCDE